MKYYAARLAGKFADNESALMSLRCPKELVPLIIANATINKSELIVADLGDGKGVALMPDGYGKTLLWQTLLGLMRDTPDEAIEDARQLAAGLNDGSPVAVFEWTPPASLSSH
jgi:hypothetical protein